MIRDFVCLDKASCFEFDDLEERHSLSDRCLSLERGMASNEHPSPINNARKMVGDDSLCNLIFAERIHSFEGKGGTLSGQVSTLKSYGHKDSEGNEEEDETNDTLLIEEMITSLKSTHNDLPADWRQQCIDLAMNSKNALLYLGKCMWLIDHHKDELESLLHQGNPLTLIDQLFDQKMNHILELVKKQVKKEKKMGIQPPEMIKGTLIPKKIADIVITKSGKINLGLLKFVQPLFMKEQAHILNYGISLKQTLDQFLKSPEIRQRFSEVRAPENTQSRMSTLVRISLGLPRDQPLTDVDAKRATIAALLSHLRQYSNRSCFAAFLAINMKRGHLISCLDDFISLLENGHLTREVDNQTKHFPFLMKMSSASLNQRFLLLRNGMAAIDSVTVCPIEDNSGLVAACLVMGILDPKNALLEISNQINGMTTPQTVIKKLAIWHAKRTKTTRYKGKYFHEGCFAFGAQEANPMLKVWVNTIAGMAEGTANSFLGTCLVKCVLNVIHNFLMKTEEPDARQITDALLKNLAYSTKYMYDPSVGFFGDDFEGGFVLYEVLETNRLKRIDSILLFKEFLKRAFTSIERRSIENPQPISLCQEFCQTSECIKQMVHYYQDLIGKHYGKLSEKDNIKPWINIFGHNAQAILDVYFESQQSHHRFAFTSKNGYHLMKKILELGRSLEGEEKRLLLENPHFMTPARVVNFHAFSLLLGHSSLKTAWQGDISPFKWMKKNLLKTGRRLANEPLSQEEQTKLTSLLEAHFEGITLLSGLSPKQAREHLLRSIKKNKAEFRRVFDAKVIEAFDHEKKKLMVQTIIHFADTNLYNGIHDVHFCFCVSPGSGKVDVWQVNDDNSGLQPLDQKDIARNAQWEIYLNA